MLMTRQSDSQDAAQISGTAGSIVQQSKECSPHLHIDVEVCLLLIGTSNV